jgi:hypothetical protein
MKAEPHHDTSIDQLPRKHLFPNIHSLFLLLYLLIEYTQVDSVRKVIAAWPGATRWKDENRRVPLHIGIIHDAPTDALLHVLETWPDATKVREKKRKWTPLHCTMTVTSRASSTIVRQIVDTYPAAATLKDINGTVVASSTRALCSRMLLDRTPAFSPFSSGRQSSWFRLEDAIRSHPLLLGLNACTCAM